MHQADNLPKQHPDQRQEHPRPRGILPWESEEQIGSLLKLTSMSMRKRIEKALRPLGLTQQQGMTLRILLHNPGSTHSDLERILRIEKPSVTNLVSVMERRGWLVRKKDVQDARFKQIYLTPEGQELAGQIAETVDQAKTRMMEALSQEEMLLLKNLLKKLRKAWEEEPQEEQEP
ncbi:MAG: transcriptional regulator [Paenibacillaceae bacterium]|jgi:DNA-binding MarR family transcriptional regulator|nr:transcriptional regulator [Paenibacillaceae bacterium]